MAWEVTVVFKQPYCVRRTHHRPAVLGHVSLYSLWQNLKFSPCWSIILGGRGRDPSPTVSWIQARWPASEESTAGHALRRVHTAHPGNGRHFIWTQAVPRHVTLFTLSNTACNSIPGLLKEMHPPRLLKYYSTFSSNMVFAVPSWKEKSALPLEPLPQLVFIAEMFTLRKPLVHIILPLVCYSHLYCSQSFSYEKIKSWQCVFHFSYHFYRILAISRP